MYHISGFTHTGTVRQINQDRILINGQIISEGFINLIEQNHCICFVSDGVGGNVAGEFAAQYVLEALKNMNVNQTTHLSTQLNEINTALLNETGKNQELNGSATTLTGLILADNIFRIIHAGDSELWLFRNGFFSKITKNMVIDPARPNSPITSFFGGNRNNLNIQKVFNATTAELNDIFLLCSDGLLQSIPASAVRSILRSNKALEEKANSLLEDILLVGAPDNTSVILIEKKITSANNDIIV